MGKEAHWYEEEKDKTDIEQILATCVSNGLSVGEMKTMTLGQIVDYCIECANRRREAGLVSEKEDKPKETRRPATQADWDRFWG